MVESADGSAICSAVSTRLRAATHDTARCPPGPAAIVIRPERISLQSVDEPVSAGHNAIAGTVGEVVYLGASTQVHVDVGADHAMVVEIPNHSGPQSVPHQPGSRVHCVCTPDAVRVLTRSPVAVVSDHTTDAVEPQNALAPG